MGIPALPHNFSTGTIFAAEVMANYNTIRDHYNANAVELGGAQTLTGIKTFSAIPVFSAGISSGAVVTVTAGGAAITGNSTITGTLNVTSALTSASLVNAGTTTLNGAALTWPAAHVLGYLKNNGSGTLSWDNSSQARSRVTPTGAYNIPTGTNPVTWGSAPINVGTMWSGGAATRVTVQTGGDGSYSLYFVGEATHDTGTANLTVSVRKNGAVIGPSVTVVATNAAVAPYVTLAIIEEAVATDFFEVFTIAGDAACNFSSGASFSVRKVGLP